MVLVSDESVEQTAVELRQLGVAEAELENLCLGWLTQRVTGDMLWKTVDFEIVGSC